MARIWQCGFELGTLSTAVEVTTTSGTLAISTSTVRTGTYALRVNPTVGTGFARFHPFAADQAALGYQRFALNAASLPTVTTTICRFQDASNNSTGSLKLTTAGKLQLVQAGGTQVGSDSAALSTGTWYTVELKTDATGSGTLDARLDGSSFASGANSAQGNWSRIVIGVITTNATADLFFDDWALNDASGSSQTSWCGSGKILHLVPTGDGDNHGWSNTANGAGSSTNWQLVDEIPPNDTTDLVQTGTLNAEDAYALTDSGIGAGDVVNVVMVGARVRNNTADATTAAKLQIKKTSGGTIAQGSAIVPNSTSFATNAPAEPRNYTLVTYTDPDGAAWTQATLDTAQAGAKLTTANVNRIQVSTLWVSVDYTPSTGTNAPAENAAATGAAQNPAVSVAPSAAAATATGTANAPTPALGSVAQVAAATGAANAATTQMSPAADLAAAAGTANAPSAGVAVSAECATAAGAASNATVTVGSGTNAQAEVAAATGAAHSATTAVTPSAAAATATASAQNPTPAPSSSPSAAAGTGAASAPSAAVAPAGATAAGTGAAAQPSASAAPSAGAASAAGAAASGVASVAPAAGAAASAATAADATVTASGGSTSADAATATAAATAYDASVETTADASPDVGVASTADGWWQLLSILREGADEVRDQASARPQACPTDGEPLRAGPDGTLYCPWDGWQEDGSYVGQ